jgi:hypothetical protein
MHTTPLMYVTTLCVVIMCHMFDIVWHKVMHVLEPTPSQFLLSMTANRELTFTKEKEVEFKNTLATHKR